MKPHHGSEVMRNQLIEALAALPAPLRRTLTWDRGTEAAKHAEVTATIGTLVYFCNPASPWHLPHDIDGFCHLTYPIVVGVSLFLGGCVGVH